MKLIPEDSVDIWVFIMWANNFPVFFKTQSYHLNHPNLLCTLSLFPLQYSPLVLINSFLSPPPLHLFSLWVKVEVVGI